MREFKLILVSNQIILRESLANFLNDLPDFQVIGDTSCQKEALDLVKNHAPDLLLVDIDLPETAIEEIVEHLATGFTSVKMILLSSFSNRKHLIELIPLNAQGYLTYDLSPEVFTRLIYDALQGRIAISPSILEEVFQELRGALNKNKRSSSCKQTGLTSREKEVLKQVASGATNRQIAHSLVISEWTVKNHIHNILGKLDVQNRSQLIFYALTSGTAGVMMIFLMVNTLGILGRFC